MDKVIDSRYYKESLFRTFIRGFVGGLGSVFGFIIGWTLLALILIELNRRYMILPKLQTYLQQVISQVAYDQLQRQTDLLNNILPNQVDSSLNVDQLKLNNIDQELLPPDVYPTNFQDLLKLNKR